MNWAMILLISVFVFLWMYKDTIVMIYEVYKDTPSYIKKTYRAFKKQHHKIKMEKCKSKEINTDQHRGDKDMSHGDAICSDTVCSDFPDTLSMLNTDTVKSDDI